MSLSDVMISLILPPDPLTDTYAHILYKYTYTYTHALSENNIGKKETQSVYVSALNTIPHIPCQDQLPVCHIYFR